LRNPGTQNYGLLPPPECVILDVDKDSPAWMAEVTERLGQLPETRIHQTPNGQHWFFRWPAHLPRPTGPWWGRVVARWPFGDDGQGYVVGPGSVVRQPDGSLQTYSVLWDAPIADLLEAWAHDVLAYRPPATAHGDGDPLFEATGYVLPPLGSVAEGARYHAVVTYTAHLYNFANGVLTKDEMFRRVKEQLAPRFAKPKTDEELRGDVDRATKDMEDRLGAPQPPRRDVAEGDPPRLLFIPTDTFVRDVRATPTPRAVIDGMWSYNGLNFVGGGPKSGKSLFVMSAGYAIAAGATVMGRATAQMPFVYMTEEGTPQDTADRLALLGLTYGAADTFTAYRTRRVLDDRYADDIVREVEQQFGSDPVLLALDPFRNYLPPGVSENEQVAVQRVLTRLNNIKAALPNLTLVVVHHARKAQRGGSAGPQDGEEMSGSGAIYAAADTTMVWRSSKRFHEVEDDGSLINAGVMTGKATVESKSGPSWKFGWTYDDSSGAFVNGEAKPIGDGLTTEQRAIVAGMAALNEGAGQSRSWTAAAIGAQVGKEPENVRSTLHRLAEKPDSPVVVDGSLFALDKWRGVAKQDQTVSGRMAALFEPDE